MKDVKFSTLLKKMETAIKENLAAENIEFEESYILVKEIEKIVNDFLLENDYPFSLKKRSRFFHQFELVMNSQSSEKLCWERKILALLDFRYQRDRQHKIQFRSILKTGPSFDLKVSELMKRRAAGITVHADESIFEAQKAGYDSIPQMLAEYELAQDKVERLKWIVFRFENLSDSDKKAALEAN